MLFGWCRNPIIAQARGFFNSTPQNRRFPAPSLRFRAVTGSQLFLIVSSQGRAARAALFFRPRQAGRYWMRTTAQRKERTPAEARSRAMRAPTAPASDAEANRARSARDWLKPMPHRERTSQHTAGESEKRKATAQYMGHLQNQNRACATGRGAQPCSLVSLQGRGPVKACRWQRGAWALTGSRACGIGGADVDRHGLWTLTRNQLFGV